MKADGLPAPEWGIESLLQQLQVLLPDISVEVLPSVASTNTLLLERARQAAGGDLAPCLLVAEEQTRGRGRLGRDWVSRRGASLTFSLALSLAPTQWEGLSLAVGLALAEALEPMEPFKAHAGAPEAEPQRRPQLQLKWPNDLWLLQASAATVHGGRKLGGVLIETIGIGSRRLCVIGVGLNVLPLPDEGLTHGLAALQELVAQAQASTNSSRSAAAGSATGGPISAPAVLARIAMPLVHALLRFEREGFAPLAAAYRRRDLLLGQRVHTTGPQAMQGVCEGVDADGALLLRCAGVLQRVVSGEVSVRWQPGAG